jgi:hypothetical protein
MVDARAAQPEVTKPSQPPGEVVLPMPYYLVLIAEAIALIVLYQARPITAGDAIGHGIGWAGTASMILMHVYSIRRRVRALWHWGKLRSWLQFHIFMGLQGALLVVFHSIHLKTVSNISGITIVCTLVVVGSGIFGRYLFSLIPKNLSGERLNARDIERELAELKDVFARSAQPSIEAAVAEVEATQPLAAHTSFFALVGEDLRARRALRHLDRALRQARRSQPSRELEDFALVVRRRAFLARRLAMLTGAERFFRNWTILHKPLTYILAGAVVLHVVAHYIYAAQFSG